MHAVLFDLNFVLYSIQLLILDLFPDEPEAVYVTMLLEPEIASEISNFKFQGKRSEWVSQLEQDLASSLNLALPL